MIFEWKVALRFLKDGKGQTIFILLGIAIGVSVQVFLSSLIGGLQTDLISQTVGSSPHINITGVNSFYGGNTFEKSNVIEGNYISSSENIKNWENIVDVAKNQAGVSVVSPTLNSNGNVVRGQQQNMILLRGVQLNNADSLYNISDGLVEGRLSLEGNQILIGKDLADEYKVGIGNLLNIQLASGRQESFSVEGIFDLGSEAVNGNWIFIDLYQTQKLLGLNDEIAVIELQVEDVFMADIIGEELQNRLNNVKVENWKDQNAQLLTALQSQSSSSLLIQFFVMMAIALGIASVLAVSVVQKSKQIGILKAMGIQESSASRIFLIQGGVLGFIGAIIGAGLGMILTRLFLWGTSRQTGEPLFPLTISIENIGLVLVIATLAGVISAFLPARRSAKLNAIEVIRGG